MTDHVQFFNSEGVRVETFPVFAPQYKIVKLKGDCYNWYRLTKDCTYELMSSGNYANAIHSVLNDCRRVNAKTIKANWHNHVDAEDSVTLETQMREGPVGSQMYLTIDGKVCQTTSVAAWRITKVACEWYIVERPWSDGGWKPVYEDVLFSCRELARDPRMALHDRLVELYRCNRGLGLYRCVAMLHEQDTADLFIDATLESIVQDAINYTRSWTARAIRVGSTCIQRDGRHSSLPLPEGCMIDWSVSQLTHLSRLSPTEVDFLISKQLIHPSNTGEEIHKVVKDYLTDYERKLMRECRAQAIQA